MEVALLWTESTDETVRSYVNGIPPATGGTHEAGLRSGVVKAVRNYIETHDLTPKGVTLTAEDIREGVVAILSLYVVEPQFQGQTKGKLNNPESSAQVDGVVRPALEKWLNDNRSIAEAVIARIILAARAREASRAASQAVSRKTAVSHRLNLPGKLADCASTNPSESELFIVEGDSAGGSAKQGRDRRTRQDSGRARQGHRQAEHHALQGPRRDDRRRAEIDDARSQTADEPARDHRRRAGDGSHHQRPPGQGRLRALPLHHGARRRGE